MANNDIFSSSSRDSFGSGNAGGAPNASVQTAIFQYGTESVVCAIKPGMSIADAFAQNADELGFDADRSVVYRCRGAQVDANSSPAPDSVYTASITHEQKGA